MQAGASEKSYFYIIFFLKETGLYRGEVDSLSTSCVCSIVAHGALSYLWPYC